MMPRGCCGHCRHFAAGAHSLESEVAGLKILSSAFGSVRDETGLCRMRDLFCMPDHHCTDWQERRTANTRGCAAPAAKGLVATGRGFAIMSRATVVNETRLGLLAAIPLSPRLVRNLSVVYFKQKFYTKLVGNFVAFAKQRLADGRPAKECATHG